MWLLLVEMSLRHRRYATSARAAGLAAVKTFSGRGIPYAGPFGGGQSRLPGGLIKSRTLTGTAFAYLYDDLRFSWVDSGLRVD